MNQHRFALALSALLVLSLGGPIGAQSSPTPPPITISDLGSLGGTRGQNYVNGMNNLGTVVGGMQMESGYHAYAWSTAGGFVDLGTLPGGTSSFAYAVNDAGQVVGSASDSSGYYSHAFIWTKSGGMVDLGTGPNGYSATAKAINSKGWVAGEFESYAAPYNRHAFFWSPSTGMRDLGSLGGQYMTVTGLNADGVVVGAAQLPAPAGYYHAFTSKMRSGPLKDLGTLGGNFSWATAINDAGKITGAADTVTGAQHAFFYTNNQMKDIQTIGQTSYGYAINADGMVAGTVDRHAMVWSAAAGMVDIGSLGGDSRATAINGSGQVTGVTYNGPAFKDQAFLWSASTGMQSLGTTEEKSSIGLAINSAGQVCGTYANVNNDQKGFFYDPATGRTNIRDKGWSQSTAVALNATGMVVGSSMNPDGYARAFVWTTGGGMSEIFTPAGNVSDAVDVNDAGQVIGHYGPPNYYTQGYLWSSSTGVIPITAGGYYTVLVAINQSGQIIGTGIDGTFQSIAFLRKADGTMVTILPPLYSMGVQPKALNDSGVVVGQFQGPDRSYRGFLWSEAGGFVDLGVGNAAGVNAKGEYAGDYVRSDGITHAYLQKTTGPRKDLGELPGTNYSSGSGINASAQVFGQSGQGGFFYDNQMRALGSLGSSGTSVPLGMNDLGQVVGWSYTETSQHGFVWSKALGMRDLLTLGGPTSKAVRINGTGKAVGEAALADGSVHAALWTTQ